jgi:hypothetical protein
MATLFGLSGAFLAKITVVYSVPTDSVHPFTQTIFPNLTTGNFNVNNFATMVFGIGPALSATIWLVAFFAAIFLLNKWYQQLHRKISDT